MIGVRRSKPHVNVVDRPLGKGKVEVTLSAFSVSFSELVQYSQTRVDNIAELERRFLEFAPNADLLTISSRPAAHIKGCSTRLPARLTAHFVAVERQARTRTTILINFAEEVLHREERPGSAC